MQVLSRARRGAAMAVLVLLAALALTAFPARAEVVLRSLETRTEGWINRTTTVTLALDAAVPFRVAVTGAGEVEIGLEGADPETRPGFVPDSVVNRYRLARTDGGALLVLEAERELDLRSASLSTLPGGGAELVLVLGAGARVDRSAVVTLEGAPSGLPLIVLDPGHGGIDPGAVRYGIAEKDIALSFGRELRDILVNSGRFEVRMTRDTDVFVSLRDRVRFAREAEAAVFVSLHANTVTEGSASGAAIYTLSEGATSREAAALAALENRADTLGGTVLGVEDDDLALLLTDMAQRETNARSAMLARATVQAMRHAVGVIRTNPHRSADFRVLKAPDVPSMLLELGFLSDDVDRANMTSPRWRAHAAEGILAALDDWVERDRVLSGRSAALHR